MIAVNFIVFLLQADTGPEQIEQFDHVAGLIPAAFTAGGIFGPALPAPLTLITYIFLHGNFMHVFGNMIFLFVFGDDIEEALGHWRFLAFYIACGIGAGLAFTLSDPSSQAELIGASGSIAGVIAAYLMFRPCAKVTVLLCFVAACGSGHSGSSAVGRSGKALKSRAGPTTTSPIGRMSAVSRPAPFCSC